MTVPRPRLLALGAAAVSLTLMLLSPAPWRPTPAAPPDGEASMVMPGSAPSRSMRVEKRAPTPPTKHPSVSEDDVEMAPAPVASRAPAGERFLVFFTHWGLSNQLLSVETALRMAEGLNRTLVLPDLLSHDASKRFRYAQLFDLGALRSVYPRVVEMRDFLGYSLAPKTLYVPYTSYDGDVESWERLGWAHVNRTMLPKVPTSATMAELIETFQDSEEQVLGFVSLFYYGNEHLRDPEVAQRMGTLLTLHPSVQQAVRAAAAQLKSGAKDGRFACMHLRRGDFAEHCHFLLDWLRKVDYIRKWHKGSDCYPTLANVARNLDVAGIADSLIYVSTDNVTTLSEPELVGFEFTHMGQAPSQLFEVLKALTDAGVPKGEAAGMLDQALCAEGHTLLLNDYSTFSDSIGYRAMAQGNGAKVVYFQHQEKRFLN